MEYTIIEVPDMNDSMSRIVINGTAYYLRFTYNDTGDYWNFGLYSDLREPIILGRKIVPNFPIGLFLGTDAFPRGSFMAVSNLQHIGRNAFTDSKAKFIFVPEDGE